jgi:thiamine kinase-like enzyme
LFDSDGNAAVIDLEFVHVGYAVNDLGYVFSGSISQTKFKKLFLKTYLNALGYPESDEDVD